LTLAYQEEFQSSTLSQWQLGYEWLYLPSELGAILAYATTGGPYLTPAIPNTPDLFDLAIETRVKVETGIYQQHIRVSGANSYSLWISSDGVASLYRATTLIQSASVSPGVDGWYTLFFSAIGNQLRASVNGTEIFSFVDDAVLPPGKILLTGNGVVSIAVDQFHLFVTEQDFDAVSGSLQPAAPLAAQSAMQPSLQLLQASIPTNRLAFLTSGFNHPAIDIAISNPDGSGVERVNLPAEATEFTPEISPDGTKIAYVWYDPSFQGSRHRELHIVDLETDLNYQISSDGRPDFDPVWSPDGTEIAFSSVDTSNIGGVYRVNVAQLNINQTDYGATLFRQNYSQPDWSPDGTRLAFATTINGSPGTVAIALENDPNTANDSFIFEATAGRRLLFPRWSPDGTKIAYVEVIDFVFYSIGDIFIHTLSAGQQNLRITSSDAVERAMDWSPDASQIIYEVSSDVRITDTAASMQSSVVNFQYPNPPLVSPLEYHPSWRGTPTCDAIVRANPDFARRSEPSITSSEIDRVAGGTYITLYGQYRPQNDFIWYRGVTNNVFGWIRSDGIELSPSCNLLPIIDPITGMEITAPYDFVLIERPPADWASLPCTEDQNITNWINCTRVVYVSFYEQFLLLTGRVPRMSDVIAAIFEGEVPAVPEQVPTGINQRAGVAASLIRAEVVAANYWSVIYEVNDPNDTNFTLSQMTESYLSQVQSWYQLANLGSPDPTQIRENLVNSAIRYQYAAFDVLSQQWVVDQNSVRQWGNIPFGDTTGYNNLYTNQQVAYCYSFRQFQNYDGDAEIVTQNDFWLDYRFVFIVGTSLGPGYTIDTYRQANYPEPEWLLANNSNGLPYRDAISGGAFLDCSQVVNVVTIP
jgi:Tol biopolymer transport system component